MFSGLEMALGNLIAHWALLRTGRLKHHNDLLAAGRPTSSAQITKAHLRDAEAAAGPLTPAGPAPPGPGQRPRTPRRCSSTI